MEWIITCDQPFDKVEKPEFTAMMSYMHHQTGSLLKIPKCDGIKWCLMKMGDDTVKEVHEMFSV
jgi:hypothetical protein